MQGKWKDGKGGIENILITTLIPKVGSECSLKHLTHISPNFTGCQKVRRLALILDQSPMSRRPRSQAQL